MERFFHKHIFHISLVILLASFVVFSSQVLAVSKPSSVGGLSANTQTYLPQQNNNQNLGSVANRQSIATGGAQQGQFRVPAFAQSRLQGSKLQACQALSKNISTRSTHMNDLVLKMEKTFDSIAQGIENYYLTKLVPQGKTVANYDALVADIQTQKSALLPLLAAIQTDISNFSCDGNNPVAQLTQYRTDMQAVLQGLQSYRKAVRNLIVAVASVKGVSESNDNSASGSARNLKVLPTAVSTPAGVKSNQ